MRRAQGGAQGSPPDSLFERAAAVAGMGAPAAGELHPSVRQRQGPRLLVPAALYCRCAHARRIVSPPLPCAAAGKWGHRIAQVVEAACKELGL